MRNKLSGTAHSLSGSRLIAVLMTACTLAVAISFVLSKNLIGDIRFNNKVNGRKNQVNKVLEQNVNALPALQENFKLLEDSGPKPSEVLAALPTTADYAGFANELEAMGALAGVQLTVVASEAEQITTESDPSGPAAPIEVTFQVSTIGGFGSLQQFLQHLETAKRPIQIKTLNFSGSDPTVNLEIDLVTFYQPVTAIVGEKEIITE